MGAAAHDGTKRLISPEVLSSGIFDDERIAERIRRDYGIEARLVGPILRDAVFDALGQLESENEERLWSREELLLAAVRAVASNSRSWARVRKVLPEVESIALGGLFTPLTPDDVRRVGEQLGGQTGNADARAIAKWVECIQLGVDVGRVLRETRSSLSASLVGPAKSSPMLVIGVATVIGCGRKPSNLDSRFAFKAPGMGPALSAEFLRNLGWPTFKPDRHIARLFREWLSDSTLWVDAWHDTFALANLLRFRSTPQISTGFADGPPTPREVLHLARLGEMVTPPGWSLNRMDQLVWLTGVYLHPKGRDVTS